jgi:hypothetical protein
VKFVYQIKWLMLHLYCSYSTCADVENKFKWFSVDEYVEGFWHIDVPEINNDDIHLELEYLIIM